MSAEIRKFELNDIDEIEKIMQQVQTLHVDWRPDIYRPINRMINEEYIQNHIDNETGYVAVIDGEVVGVLEVTYRHIEAPTHVTRNVIFIDTMAVDENHRNMGIGTLFFEKVKELKKEKELDGIELQVNARNEAALGMYQKAGFTFKSINMELL